MNYLSQTKVDKSLVIQDKDEEYFIRQTIITLISTIPIDELKKLFSISKLDPNSIENFIKINNENTKFKEYYKIMLLKQDNMIEFEAGINI
jgi:hypothetical protein